MSHYIRSENLVYCGNDCLQTGCPGHTVTLDYHTTSDTVLLKADNRILCVMDDNIFNAFIRLANTP